MPYLVSVIKARSAMSSGLRQMRIIRPAVSCQAPLAQGVNDVAFFTTAVHVKCEEGYFENLDYICEACPLPGTECLAGSTLLNLPVIPGFWRSGEVWSWKC